MKFSESWLREWVNPKWTTQELVAEITMAGLEVDAVEPVASNFSGIVVAEIIEIEQHPDADKLRVCKVQCGEDELVQVVCGASNARVGLKAAFAKVGAVLKTEDDSDFKIKKAKLRGVPSFGMLCGASELGMDDQVDGLMELPVDAPIGEDVKVYLQLDDTLIDVDLTPNRGDCLSILGIARDVGVLSQCDLVAVEVSAVEATSDAVFPVILSEPEHCSVYASRVIKNIDLSQETPLWMVEKLRRSGVRSIDPVVDVTNFVLLELGQPMHAFDLAKLDSEINVRFAKPEEKLTLLDGQEIELKPESLVIADKNNALALAGIMGGLDSGVSAETQDIMLESAFFRPEKIAGRARDYGLHTDSSHRFERGVDNAGQARAIERATALLLDIVGGEAGPTVVYGLEQPVARTVELNRKRLAQVLGVAIDDAKVEDILVRLGLVVSTNAEGWHCIVPSWRFDISIQADLFEEIARIFGYNQLPTRQLRVPVDFVRREEAVKPLSVLKQALVARGYQEAITYTFIEPKLQQAFSDETPVAVANPISADMAVMRTSLLPGLVKALQHNLNRQVARVKLFESGLQFHASNKNSTGAEQNAFIAGIAIGSREPESWTNSDVELDFFDVKADIEGLLSICRATDVRFESASHKGLHPGQTANVFANGKLVGFIGGLHPELRKTLGITGQAYAFELSLAELTSGSVSSFHSLSKFPQVRRDIALVVDETVSLQSLQDIIRKNGGEQLLNSWLFDVYQGQGIAEGKKSLAIAMSFQHQERSLNDEEVQETVNVILEQLEQKLAAVLR